MCDYSNSSLFPCTCCSHAGVCAGAVNSGPVLHAFARQYYSINIIFCILLAYPFSDLRLLVGVREGKGKNLAPAVSKGVFLQRRSFEVPSLTWNDLWKNKPFKQKRKSSSSSIVVSAAAVSAVVVID